MPLRYLAIFMLLMFVSCDDTSTGDGLGRANFGGTLPSALACPWSLSEVFVSSDQRQFVELAFDPNAESNTLDWALCSFDSCHELGTIDSAAEFKLALSGLDDVTLGSSGELALFADQTRVGDPLAICAYVAWGQAPEANANSLNGAAIAAGLWAIGDFVAYDGSSQLSISAGAPQATGAADWGCSLPSPQQANNNISACPSDGDSD